MHCSIEHVRFDLPCCSIKVVIPKYSAEFSLLQSRYLLVGFIFQLHEHPVRLLTFQIPSKGSDWLQLSNLDISLAEQFRPMIYVFCPIITILILVSYSFILKIKLYLIHFILNSKMIIFFISIIPKIWF